MRRTKVVLIVTFMLIVFFVPCYAFADTTITINNDGEVTTYTQEEYDGMLEEAGYSRISSDELHALEDDVQQYSEDASSNYHLYQAEHRKLIGSWILFAIVALIFVIRYVRKRA